MSSRARLLLALVFLVLLAQSSVAETANGYERYSNKGQPNGYAGLDASGLVPVAQLPGIPAAWGAITGVLSAQTDLQSALDGKEPSGTFSGVGACAANQWASTLNDTAAPSCTQPGFSNLSGTASDAQIPAAIARDTETSSAISAHEGATDPHTGYQKESEKAAANGYAGLDANTRVPTAQLGSGTADSTKFLRGDQTWAVPSGGSDPWSYAKLSGDFSTTSSTAVDVTGLSFTPQANTTYEFEAVLLLRTATATVNPRAGLAWATGLTDGVAQITESQAATGAPLGASGNPNAALLVAVGGLPNTTQSWPARISGMVVAGASPSSTVRIQLASETSGTSVTAKTGSFLRWRALP